MVILSVYLIIVGIILKIINAIHSIPSPLPGQTPRLPSVISSVAWFPEPLSAVSCLFTVQVPRAEHRIPGVHSQSRTRPSFLLLGSQTSNSENRDAFLHSTNINELLQRIRNCAISEDKIDSIWRICQVWLPQKNVHALFPQHVNMLPYMAKQLCRCDSVKNVKMGTLSPIIHVGLM